MATSNGETGSVIFGGGAATRAHGLRGWARTVSSVAAYAYALTAAATLGCKPPPDNGGTETGTTTGTTDGTTVEDVTGPDKWDYPPPGIEHPHGPIRAGVAVGYLSDPVGVSMAGYGARIGGVKTPWRDQLNGTRGFYGYQTVKAMVIEVEGQRIVLLKSPTMSSEHSLTDGTAAKLAERHGIDLEGRILTAAGHSHHTHARYWRVPQQLALVGADSPDDEVIDRITTVFADTIKAAIDDLGDAEWGFGYVDDWDPENRVYRDRRGENDPTYGKDPRLTMLAVRRLSGKPMAAIFNFASHGTVFDADNELWTEDAPGGVEMKFEEHFFAQEGAPIFGMFVQSGGGDASPAGDHLGHPEPARIELIGEAAAPKILDLYGQLRWKRDATLAVRSRRLDLRYDDIGYANSDEFIGSGGIPYQWGGWQCMDDAVVDDGNPDTSMEGRPKNCNDVGAMLESFGEPVPHAEFHQTYLTSALLGDVVLMSMPGEPANSLIQYAREQIATRDHDGAPVQPMIFGYSQDHLLYLTNPDDWFQGGYESEMSLWGPLAGKYLVDTQLELIDGILAGEDAPSLSEDSPSLNGPSGYTPRELEVSANPGTITIDAPATVARGATVRFGWAGGDPSIGSPHVVLEVDPGDGEFVPYPSPSGWPGTSYDNTRYHMLTHYEPDPPPNGMISPLRTHTWFVDWQVPLDFPGARVRLVATGAHWDGSATTPHEVVSRAFIVQAEPGAELIVTPAGERTELDYSVPAPPYVLEDTYPSGGYRLFDPTVGPQELQRVHVPLRVWFSVEGETVAGPYDAVYDADAGAHVFDAPIDGLAEDALIHAHHAADIIPSLMTGKAN